MAVPRRLSPEQAERCAPYVGLAYWVAHKVWRRLSGRARDLEELRSEALVALVEITAKDKGQGDFTAFLRISLDRKLSNFLTSQRAKLRLESSLPEEAWPLIEESRELPRTWRREPPRMAEVRKALALLTPRQRDVIEYTYGLNGKPELGSYRMGEELGIGGANGNSRLHHALKALKKKLNKGGVPCG